MSPEGPRLLLSSCSGGCDAVGTGEGGKRQEDAVPNALALDVRLPHMHSWQMHMPLQLLRKGAKE